MRTCTLSSAPSAMPTIRRALLAGLAAFSIGLAVPAMAQGQQGWRGLDVPQYAGASDVSTEIDSDEYELYFHTADDTQKVFDFYRDALERQGFEVVSSKTKKRGYKAHLRRGQGGPEDTIELDVKKKHGRVKVEIEFDD